MDSIANILSDKNLDEPSDIVSLRKFLDEEFNIDPLIKVYPNSITIFLDSPALSQMIRLRYPEIERRCQLTKKLFIKLG